MRFLLTVIPLLLISLSAAAVPQPTPLTDYVSPDVMLYAEVKLDDATVAGVDSLIASLASRAGVRDIPALGNMLDSLQVRAWLGEEAALVVFPSVSLRSPVPNLALLLEIRDRARIEEALVNEMDAQRLPLQGDWSYYRVDNVGVSVNNHLLIASSGVIIPTFQPDHTLTTYEPFVKAMAALPASDYAARLYFDPRGLITALALQSPEAFDAAAVNLPVLMDSLGVIGAGLTQLDDRSYALDVVHRYGSRHIFSAIYAPTPEWVEAAPIDTDFLSAVPADAFFAVQTSRPWPQFRALLSAIAIGGNALRTRAFLNARALEQSTGINPITSPLALMPASLSTAVILNLIEGTLDMDDAELSAAFNGQAAVAGRITQKGPEFLLAVETTGQDVGRKVVRGVASLLPLLKLPEADISERNITFMDSGPFGRLRLLATDFGDALYFGSDAMIVAEKFTCYIVLPINQQPTFVHDRALFLPDMTHLAYVNLKPLRGMSGASFARAGSPDLSRLLDLFDSFWISARVDATQTLTRFAFTLTAERP